MAAKRTSSLSVRTYFVSALAGIAVGLVDHLINLWMAAHGLHAEMTLVDDFLLAIFTAALVFVIELSHRQEQERTNEKLRTIELMNHHVRNALQSIIDSAYVHGNLDEVRTSVDRIAWALQEVLPGRALDHPENPHAQSHEPRPNPPQIKAG